VRAARVQQADPPGRPAQEVQARRLLALADEEGYVTVVDAGAPLPRDLHLNFPAWDTAGEPLPRPRAQWEAHKNAVFDLAWAKARRGRGALTQTPSPDRARAPPCAAPPAPQPCPTARGALLPRVQRRGQRPVRAECAAAAADRAGGRRARRATRAC